MRLRLIVLFGYLVLFCGPSFSEMLDIQAVLPLFEKNSIEGKILEVSYSLNYELKYKGKVTPVKKDVHLVFDAKTGMYRKEEKYYNDPTDAEGYRFTVEMWNGKEYVLWSRVALKKPGFRALKSGIFEHSGHAEIRSQPPEKLPFALSFFLDSSDRPFSETVLKHNPQLRNISGDRITIETESNKFEFSKKTGALERIDYTGKDVVYFIYTLSNHVEYSGVWIPLRIVISHGEDEDGWKTQEVTVDPKVLRLLDSVEDISIFNEALPAGCFVDDDIKKQYYRVTIAEALPNDVEVIKQVLEKMLEQAQDQKATIEKGN